MDPQNRANLWEHIMRLREQHGTTIVLTTHYLEEADSMAERVVVIDHGRIIADDTPARLKAKQAGDRITFTVGPADVPRAREVAERAGEVTGAESGTVTLRAESGDRVLPGLLAALANQTGRRAGGDAAPADPRRRLPQPHRSQSARRSGRLMATMLTDIRSVWIRESLTIWRDPFSLIFSLLQPLIFLGLFGPLLSGDRGRGRPGRLLAAVVPPRRGGDDHDVRDVDGGLQPAVRADDRRLRADPGHPTLASGAARRTSPQGAGARWWSRRRSSPLVAVPFGFELFPAHIVLGLLLLGVFGVGVGSLSYALAIAARKNEWIFWAVQQTLLFPLLILSGMMLPLETGPEWMQVLSKLNPLTYMVEAERALFTGQLGVEVLWGVVAASAHRWARAAWSGSAR